MDTNALLPMRVHFTIRAVSRRDWDHDRLHIHRHHRRIFCNFNRLHAWVREASREATVTDTLWIGAATVLVFVYLLYALLVPEKFW